MSYQVLARKWRPQTFETMVGQEHVLRMLINALDNQRLHHAYLFTGTRGVGKTTIARIFAKCLNCEKGISSKPCGECSTCQAIDTGRFVDLLEIDAASRTKVEDTRELLENVHYAPTQGRFKVYLIDEVHMLSTHSFNALLKTLEEPPAHVKFLLATTDPKRLPITILSRCLQFNLKRVPDEQISKHLEFICQSEKIEFDSAALQLIASGGDGSLRDALSLLDQAIAFCHQKISLAETRQMLGHIEQHIILRLLTALAKQDGKQLFAEITHLNEQAPDYHLVLSELLSTLHQIAITQLIPDIKNQPETIIQLASQFSPEETQLHYQIALNGKRDLANAPHPARGFEMLMLRMLAFKPEEKSILPKTPSTTIAAPVSGLPRPAENAGLAMTGEWSTLIPKLQLTGMAQALATNCILLTNQNNRITLALSPQHKPMLSDKLIERIEQAMTNHFGQPIKLEINVAAEDIHTPAKEQQKEFTEKHATATNTIKNDEYVQKIVDIFGATLDDNSIKAIDSI